MTPEIVFECSEWDVTSLDAQVARACAAVSERYNLSDWDVTIMACDDARIAELNGEFRNKARATNVLSWPSAERGAGTPGGAPLPPEPDMFGDMHLGDIAIARETCVREAEAGGIPVQDHLVHLLIHGLLHLLGYDHENDADADLMEEIEIALLAPMGIVNPYVIRDKA